MHGSSRLAPLRAHSPKSPQLSQHSRSSLHSRSSASNAGFSQDESSPGHRPYIETAMSPAASDTNPPPSHIPAEFHVREEGVLVFPSRRQQGDHDVPKLEKALRDMLVQWRNRLDKNKPSFPMSSTLWGVMQTIVYDIWCTVEETRIYDIAFVESLRMTHFYSPPLAIMLGKIRTRIAQSFGAVLAMSRRLEVEMQRLHTQWTEIGESFHKESSLRQAAQFQSEQLRAKLAMLEARNLSKSRDTHAPGEASDGARSRHLPMATASPNQAQSPRYVHSHPACSDRAAHGAAASASVAGERKEEALVRLQSEVLTLGKKVWRPV